LLVLCLVLTYCARLSASSAIAQEESDPAAEVPRDPDPAILHVPDGQLQSGLIRVYVNRPVSLADRPQLIVRGSHAMTSDTAAEGIPFPPAFIASDQRWIDDEAGVTHEVRGTLLLFDLRESPPAPWYKAMTRLTPILRWGEGQHEVIASRAINIGNPVAAWVWTLILIATTVLLLAHLSRERGTLSWLMHGEDGHLALSKAQVAAWTIAIGSVVTFYGLVRLRVPDIPDSLVWLMGMSLATGGLPYLAPEAPSAVPPADRRRRAATPKLADLITDFSDPDMPQPSIARAQMLFWTLILIVIFVTKSALDGELWDVPLELVALMGLSQAGYVTPKFLPAVKTSTPTLDHDVGSDTPENRAARAGTPGVD
jgi:hypothetical protein